jgi:hypothetical protein
MNKSNLYISKKCPHCRRLLLILRDRHDLTPSLNIIPIEDYQYPQYIKAVPSMVVNDSIWNAERIFSFIEQSGRQQQPQMGQQQLSQQQHQGRQQQLSQQQMGQQQMGQQQGSQQQLSQRQMGQQQMGQQQLSQQPQMGQPQKDAKEKEISGFCLDSGSCSLSFASFGDEMNPVDFDRYSGISDKNDSTPQSSTNDNFVEKSKRSNEFDSKYENMLAERNNIH